MFQTLVDGLIRYAAEQTRTRREGVPATAKSSPSKTMRLRDFARAPYTCLPPRPARASPPAGARLIEPDTRVTLVPPPHLLSPTSGTPVSSAAAAAVDGIEDWLSLLDQALQGLHHALNNRIGTLAALVELAELQEMPSDGSADEKRRRRPRAPHDCNRVVHLLRRDRIGAEEPLLLDDVLADAYAIHRYLHDVRDVQVTAPSARTTEPVRVERWAALRVLTLLLYDARRAGKRIDKLVRTSPSRATSGCESTSASATTATGVWRTCQCRARALRRGRGESLGGRVVREAGAVGLMLPTLKSRRAREGR